MTVRNPLFEFMPYGAPELLSAQRAHLVRALALASLLVLTVFLLARVLGLSMPGNVLVDIPIITRPAISIEPPPSIRVATALRVPSVTPTSAVRDGKLVIVRDEDKLTPTEILAPPSGDLGVGDVPGDAPPSTMPPGTAAFVPEVFPARREFVYTDEMPVLAKVVKPEYPELAKELGIEGRVYVHMLVGKDGRVVRAEVDEQINEPLLNTAALEAARKWVFQPALVNKHPIPVWVGEAFIFKINQ